MKKRPHLVVIPETQPYGVESDAHAVAPTVEAVDENEVPTVRRRALELPERADSAGRYSLVFGRRRATEKPPRR